MSLIAKDPIDRRYLLAEKIARDIFRDGDWPTPCQRIEFKGGTYPDQETNQGGYNEGALANAIYRSLLKSGH